MRNLDHPGSVEGPRPTRAGPDLDSSRVLADPSTIELPAPFAWVEGHLGAWLGGGEVRFTTRAGGVSEGPYASLDLGDHVGDDPAHVAANRERVAEHAGAASWDDVAWAHQVHGTTVTTTGDADHGKGPDADGQATAAPGKPVAVFTADCLPVVLVAEGGVAALHAGWKGAAGARLSRRRRDRAG